MTREDFRSGRKESVSIEWSWWKECMVGGGSGVGLIGKKVKAFCTHYDHWAQS